MTSEISVESLQALTDCLGRAQFTCLVRSESGMVAIEDAAMALVANVLAKAHVLSEAESILVFDKLRPQFAIHCADLILEQSAGNMFQVLVINPWSNSACVTCTGHSGYIRMSDGASVSRQGTVFVSLAVNVSALLISVWRRLTQQPSKLTTGAK